MKAVRSGELKNASVNGVSFEPPATVSISELKFTLPLQRFLIPIVLSEIDASMELAALLMLQTNFRGRSNLFGGNISFESSKGIFQDIAEAQIHAEGLKLSQISPLSTFGVGGNARGAINAQFKLPQQRYVGPQSATINLDIREISFPGGTIPGMLFPLPQISGGKLTADGLLKSGTFVGKARVDCNLGNISGEIDTGGMRGVIQLSDEGEAKYGAMLAALSGRTDILDKKHWRFTISRDLRSIKVSPGTP